MLVSFGRATVIGCGIAGQVTCMIPAQEHCNSSEMSRIHLAEILAHIGRR